MCSKTADSCHGIGMWGRGAGGHLRGSYINSLHPTVTGAHLLQRLLQQFYFEFTSAELVLEPLGFAGAAVVVCGWCAFVCAVRVPMCVVVDTPGSKRPVNTHTNTHTHSLTRTHTHLHTHLQNVRHRSVEP